MKTNDCCQCNLSAPWNLTAREMMIKKPLSIRAEASLHEAAAFLAENDFHVAPVIDARGRTIGMISRSDLMLHRDAHAGPRANGHAKPLAVSCAIDESPALTVRDLTTPAVFHVPPEATMARVLTHMLGLNVRRLFVVDEDGLLLGVISSHDLLRLFLRAGQMYHHLCHGRWDLPPTLDELAASHQPTSSALHDTEIG